MTGPPAVAPDDIVLRDESFRLLRIPPGKVEAVERRLADFSPRSFRFTVVEEDGLTLLISTDDLAKLGDLAEGAEREETPYRVITFRQDMAWTVVGFLHRVCGVLAEREIPLGAISAFARDHLFVRENLAAQALEALRAAAADGRLSG